MMTTVTNFGDSLGVQFPKSLLKKFPVSENDNVDIMIMDNSIIIKRQENIKHLTTKERIAAYYESADDIRHPEIDWGKPQGREIW